jgi:hypothetical protein
MPTTSRAFVRASIIYLALGSMLGALLLVNRWILIGSAIAVLRISHIEFLVVGWLTQLIMGVAWWLFPTLTVGRRPGDPKPIRRGQAQRGSEPIFWMTFVSLNLGVLLRALFGPVYSWTKIATFNTLAGISGLFLLAAAIGFVLNTWRRVRELGQRK